MARTILAGHPGSPGSGVGRLLWIGGQSNGKEHLHTTRPSGRDRVPPDDVQAEERRLMDALEAAAIELDALARETAGRAGPEIGAIFEAQGMFARDPGLIEPAVAAIRGGETAEAAIDRVAAEQAETLAGVDDPYFRERAADLRDVGRRVLDRLTGRTRPDLHHRDGTPAVVAADDLDPSAVAGIRPELVSGLALAAGASCYEAARLANYAGGLVVMKRGTATVSAKELADAVTSDHDTTTEHWSQERPPQGRRLDSQRS